MSKHCEVNVIHEYILETTAVEATGPPGSYLQPTIYFIPESFNVIAIVEDTAKVVMSFR
jgi:hypothetical protein